MDAEHLKVGGSVRGPLTEPWRRPEVPIPQCCWAYGLPYRRRQGWAARIAAEALCGLTRLSVGVIRRA